MFQKVLYYSGFIFSCYAFVFILWQNQAYKFRRFKFPRFFHILTITNILAWELARMTWAVYEEISYTNLFRSISAAYPFFLRFQEESYL